MIGNVYFKLVDFFKKDSKKLFFVSFTALLMSFAVLLLSLFVPIIGIAVICVLWAGVNVSFSDASGGKQIKTEDMFMGFDQLLRVCGGMLWMLFKSFVWLLIPFIGVFITLVKIYEYRFVPYILIKAPEIKAIDAPHASSVKMRGFKWYMFASEWIVISLIGFSLAVWWILSSLPQIGVFFTAVMIIEAIATALLFPMFSCGITAVFDDEIKNASNKRSNKDIVCPHCSSRISEDSIFCSTCGESLMTSLPSGIQK